MKLVLKNITNNTYVECEDVKEDNIKIVIQEVDPINPQTLKNSYSKTVSIPFNSEVCEFFNSINRIDASYGDNNFNLSVKNEFILYNDSTIVESGYFILTATNYDSYSLQLFSEFGKLMYSISNGNYVDTNDLTKGTDTMLKNLGITFTDSNGNSKDFVITKDFIYSCFTAGISTDSNGNQVVSDPNNSLIYATYYDYAKQKTVTEVVVTFAPTYQGNYQFFDNKKGYYYDNSGNSVIDEDELTNKGMVGGIVIQNITSDNIDENNRTFFANGTDIQGLVYSDYRSYYQRPFIKVSFILNNIFNHIINNLGYTLNLDNKFFNFDNPYWNNLWCVLPNLPIMDRSRYDESLTKIYNNVISNTKGFTWTIFRPPFGTTYETTALITPYITIDPTNWRDRSKDGGFRYRQRVYEEYKQETYITLDPNDTNEFININVVPTITCALNSYQLANIKVNQFGYPSMNEIGRNPSLMPMQYETFIGGSDTLKYEFWQDVNGDGTYSQLSRTLIISIGSLLDFYDSNDEFSYNGQQINYLNPQCFEPMQRGYTVFTLTKNDISQTNRFVTLPKYNTLIKVTPEYPNNFLCAFHSYSFNPTTSWTVSSIPTQWHAVYLQSPLVPEKCAVWAGYTPQSLVDNFFAAQNNTVNNNTVYHPTISNTYVVRTLSLSDINSDSVRSGSKIFWGNICKLNTTMFDFLTSYLKYFGLYPNTKYKEFNIFTRNSYYNSIDLSLENNVIKDSVYSINPIPFDYSQAVFGTQNSDSFIEKQYELKTNSHYGDLTIQTPNNFTNNVKEIFDNIIFFNTIVGSRVEGWYNGRANTPLTDNKELLFDYTDSNSTSNSTLQLVFLDGTTTLDTPFVISDDSDSEATLNGYRFFEYDKSAIFPDTALLCNQYPNYSTIYPSVITTNYSFSTQFYNTSIVYGSFIPSYSTVYERVFKKYLDDLFNKETRKITANLYINDDIATDINRKIFLINGRYVNIYKVYDYVWGKAGAYKCDMITVNDLSNYVDSQDLLSLWGEIALFNYGTILSTKSIYSQNIDINMLFSQIDGVCFIFPLSGFNINLIGETSIYSSASSEITTSVSNCTISPTTITNGMENMTVNLPATQTSYRFNVGFYFNSVFFGQISGVVGALNTFVNNILVFDTNGLHNLQPTATEYTQVNQAALQSEYPYPTTMAISNYFDGTKYGFLKADHWFNDNVVTTENNVAYNVNPRLDCNVIFTNQVYLYDITQSNTFTVSCPTSIYGVTQLNTPFNYTAVSGGVIPIPINFDWYVLSGDTTNLTFSWFTVTNKDSSVIDYVNNGLYSKPDISTPIYIENGTPQSVACVYNKLYLRTSFNNDYTLIDFITSIDWTTTKGGSDFGNVPFVGNQDYVFNNTTDIVSYENTEVEFNICGYDKFVTNSGYDQVPILPAFLTSIVSTSFRNVDSNNHFYDYDFVRNDTIDDFSGSNGFVLLFTSLSDYDYINVYNGSELVSTYNFPTSGTVAGFAIQKRANTILNIHHIGGEMDVVTPENISGYMTQLWTPYQDNTTFNGVYSTICSTPDTYLTVTVTPYSTVGSGLDLINNYYSRLRVTLFDSSFNVIDFKPSEGATTYTWTNLDSSKTYYFGITMLGDSNYRSWWNNPLSYDKDYIMGSGQYFNTNIPSSSLIAYNNVPNFADSIVGYNDSGYATITNLTAAGSNTMIATLSPRQLATNTDSNGNKALGVPEGIGVGNNIAVNNIFLLNPTTKNVYAVISPTTLNVMIVSGTTTSIPNMYGFVEDNFGWTFNGYDITESTQTTSATVNQCVICQDSNLILSANSLNTYYPMFTVGGSTYIAYLPPAGATTKAIMFSFNSRGLNRCNPFPSGVSRQVDTSNWNTFNQGLIPINNSDQTSAYYIRSYNWGQTTIVNQFSDFTLVATAVVIDLNPNLSNGLISVILTNGTTQGRRLDNVGTSYVIRSFGNNNILPSTIRTQSMSGFNVRSLNRGGTIINNDLPSGTTTTFTPTVSTSKLYVFTNRV